MADFDLSMIDMTQTVPQSTASLINAGGMLMLSVFLVLAFIFFVRYKSKVVPLLLGIFAYIIFIFMGCNVFISMLPEFAKQNGKAGGIEICVTALVMTVFFTIARICIANIMRERYEGPGDALIAGLGLGVGDAAVYGFTTIMVYGVLAAAINQTGLEELLLNTGLPAEDAVDLYVSTILPLIKAPSVVWLLMGISLCMDMLMNVALMMINCGVVQGKLSNMWYFISAAFNFVMLALFTFNSTAYRTVFEAVMPFGIKVIVFIVLLVIVIRIDKEKLGSTLSKDLKGYTYQRMPHFGNLKNK